MKERIESFLQQLVGFQLTNTTRAADMECFHFDHIPQPDRQKKEVETNVFSLHIQSPWRLTTEHTMLIGSLDVFQPADVTAEYDEDFNWDYPMANLRDYKLNEVLQTNKLTVVAVVADSFGGFELLFDSEIKLTVFPASSSQDNYSEFWRLLDKRAESKRHYVVSNSTITID